MKYPKIKFLIDQKEDIANACYFLESNRKNEQFLKWFLPIETHFILSKKFPLAERKKIIREYAKKVYRDIDKVLHGGVKRAEKEWGKHEERFFNLVDIVFKGHPWPKTDYTGIVTIFFMYPRYLSRKLFFFPYKNRANEKSTVVRVIGHEMLHFIFYDYIEKKHGMDCDARVKNEKKDYLWRVSEVFNCVIENWKPYKKIIPDSISPYPGQEKMFRKMKLRWSKKQDIDWLLDKWLK